MPNTLPVPHYQQLNDGYCLPACVQMVLAYLGMSRKQTKLAAMLGTIPEVGTPGSQVRQLACRHLDVTYTSGNIDALRNMLEQNIPPIMLVHTKELPYLHTVGQHAVVLCGVDKEVALINDPELTHSHVNVNLGDLLLAWDEMANLYIVLKKMGS